MIGKLNHSITHSLNHSIIHSIAQSITQHGLVLDNSSSCHYIGYCFAPDGVQAKMGAVGDRTGSKAVS